jgi:hypothetical protein
VKAIKINQHNSILDNYTGVEEWENGNKFWYKEGNLHRLDGPAIELSDGTKYWYKEGEYHRLNGPAIELSDGTKYWYKEGKRHRLDGPAREYSDGTKEWWIEDNFYAPKELSELINFSFFLGKEKGQYNLKWLKFLTEKRIEEFPIIPEMKSHFRFKNLFKKLSL